MSETFRHHDDITASVAPKTPTREMQHYKHEHHHNRDETEDLDPPRSRRRFLRRWNVRSRHATSSSLTAPSGVLIDSSS
jgi:hypothetical protein